MAQYCRKCGKELDDDAEFCDECGNPIYETKNSKITINKKTAIIGILTIIIIAIIGLFALTGGNIEDAQYLTANTISIDSVSSLGSDQISPTEYSDYNGAVQSFRVVYTAKTDLKNVSIETQAYDENGEHLDAMANWMGFNPLNILAYEEDLTSGTSYTGDVVFGAQNQTHITVSKLEVYVYQSTPDENKLIDKFTYNME